MHQLLLAAVYVVAAKLGLMLALVNASATAVWPPTGIALASLLLLGNRMWPAIALGAFIANLTTSQDVLSSLCIACGNTLEAVVGASLVRRWARGADAFAWPQDIFKYSALAGLGATAISASVGTATLYLFGLAKAADCSAVWTTWWLGDAGSALVIAPLILLWARDPPLQWTRPRALEASGLLLILLSLGVARLGGYGPLSNPHHPLAFMFFPLLMWVALRLGPSCTILFILITYLMCAWGTLHGFGQWDASLNTNLIILQSFMGVTSVSVLSLTATVKQRDTAQAALLAAQQELEMRVLQRTQELSQALSDLRHASEAKSMFLASVSHELRTPLNSIIGYSDLLLNASPQELTSDHWKRSLEFVHSAGMTLLRLINDLLDLARMEAGRLDVNPSRFSLMDAIRHSSGIVAPLADAKSLRLILPSADVGTLHADPARFQQILFNLLSNAIKFTPVGGTVEVTVEHRSDQVRVSVRDSGVGIAAADQARIFEAFEQVGYGGEGTGLGLAIVWQLTRAQGGSVELVSAPDQGSCFTVVFPIIEESDRPAASP